MTAAVIATDRIDRVCVLLPIDLRVFAAILKAVSTEFPNAVLVDPTDAERARHGDLCVIEMRP